MKRSRTKNRRNPTESRERLLQAGIKLFARRGPDATTVEMIARFATINRRMIYHYFKSKAGLYRAVIQRMYEDSVAVEIELAHMLLPAEELLERMIRSQYEYFAEKPEFVRLLTWENLRQGRTAKEVDIFSIKAPILQALGIVLERGKQEGRFRSDVDEKQLLISCMALTFFYFSNQHTVGRMLRFDLVSKQALRKRVRHVVRLLLHGIEVDRAAGPQAE